MNTCIKRTLCNDCVLQNGGQMNDDECFKTHLSFSQWGLLLLFFFF